MEILESAFCHEKLLFSTSKTVGDYQNKNGIFPPSGQSLAEESLNHLKQPLSLHDSNRATPKTNKKVSKSSSCLKPNRKRRNQKNKIGVFITRPQIHLMNQSEIKKELLSHKNLLMDYVSYSCSQDAKPLNLKIGKLIQNESFAENFFTFKKQKGGSKSKHIYVVLDGTYLSRDGKQDGFAQRIFEENEDLDVVEFVWQKFLNVTAKSIERNRIMNDSFRKRFNSNYLGNFYSNKNFFCH